MLQPEKVQAYLDQISEHRLPAEDCLKRDIFKCGLWLMGIPAIIYGAIDRGMAAFAGNAVALTDLSYCLIALVILFGWVFIGMADDPLEPIPEKSQSQLQLLSTQGGSDCIAQKSYRLPFPFICQIYHLLNLKHLEEIHRFSLGNLKVLKVSHFHKTQVGGRLRFKTVLDSPLNVLRLWRSPSVDVELTIHSPHQIELKVPAYGQKCIRVLFNVIPINEREHQLLVQMFTDLQWPKELLRVVLLLASSLTLLEDLPYLSQLANRNLATPNPPGRRGSACQTMQLYHRYVDLYTGYWERQQLQLTD